MKFLIFPLVVAFIACGPHHHKTKKEIFEQKAFYYYDHNKFYDARSWLDSLIDLDSTNGKYYFERAYSEDRLQFRNASINDYFKAIHYKYKAGDAYCNIALSAMEDDKDSLALVLLAKAYEAEPNKKQMIYKLVKLCKSDLELQKNPGWKEFQEYKRKAQSAQAP